MPRPLVATISSAAMQHNLSVVRSRVPGAKVWAVVKANAYGHGLKRSVRALSGADGLALIEFESALHLREMGWNKPILLLEGFFESRDLPTIAEHKLEFSVHCNEQIEMLESVRLVTPLDVHLKMNTGMNRLGFKPHEFRAAWERLRAIPWVGRIAFMTHFANAEERGACRVPVSEQHSRFCEGIAGLSGEINISNSAAILLHADLKTNWVRPGIMLYGGSPGGKTAQEFGLRPAMTLNSEIIQTLDIAPGEAVGYGSIFVADKPTRIGVVACGYADGYPRNAPDGTPVLVEGIRTRLVGRVSMDMITVDLTPVPQARVGSVVTLWGDGLPIDEVAAAAGTVGYELLCALSMRPRIIES